MRICRCLATNFANLQEPKYSDMAGFEALMQMEAVQSFKI